MARSEYLKHCTSRSRNLLQFDRLVVELLNCTWESADINLQESLLHNIFIIIIILLCSPSSSSYLSRFFFPGRFLNLAKTILLMLPEGRWTQNELA